MSIRIVVDSACDLPEDLARTYAIKVVPMYVNIGMLEYRDGIDLSRADFYEHISGYHPFPTTATPGPGTFRQAYEELIKEGASEILSLHISPALSSVVNHARVAAESMPEAKITVLDSQQLSLGAGFLAVTAAKAAADGKNMPEILALLEDQIKRTYVFAALDTLEYLKRSGRMSGMASLLGNLLQIKPIMRMYAGKPSSEKMRTRWRAVVRLVAIFKSLVPLESVALVYTRDVTRAEALLEQVKGLLPDKPVFRTEITPVLGAHVGPGVIGFVCVTQKTS
jgi:DegV family protein with EDD domain